VRADTDDARGTDVAGNVGGDRVFAGTREFEIDPQPDGTVLFTHVEDVSGLLFPVFRALMGLPSRPTATTSTLRSSNAQKAKRVRKGS
jgi:hypothetical protein